MTVKDMHYSFKLKLNKVDSQQYRNLLVPEIDWQLNSACNLFIKMIAEPRSRQYGLGFESSQRVIDDIRTLVEKEDINVVDGLAPFPARYQHYLRSRAVVSKGVCTDKLAIVHPQRHDHTFEESANNRSSFEWRRVNALFISQGLQLFTDGSFSISSLQLSYIRKHLYIHNAEDFRSGSYSLPSGTVLTGTQDCELPDHVHEEIVDLAVLTTSGELESQTYPLKREQVNLNLS